MRSYLPVACLICLTAVLIFPGQGTIVSLLAAAPAPQPEPKTGPIRVLVPKFNETDPPVIVRLRDLKFEVTVLPFGKVDPAQLKNIDVILLPTGWGDDSDHFKHFEAKRDEFQRFVKAGGGLLICQPNPHAKGTCTPQLLPYPIAFQNGYDDSKPERVNLDPAHFITEDLPGAEMPFPADPMIKVDRRYTILAKQKSTEWPSLAVCSFGDGRVVVQTANEGRGATIPITDELLRRMIVWSAGREPPRR